MLVIDDEKIVLESCSRIFSAEGFEVTTTDKARRGLELAVEGTFDVILCDMMMSELSGMDLHRWLVAHHPRLARQLIFVTGGAFTPRARAYLAEVDNPRLDKPFDAAR